MKYPSRNCIFFGHIEKVASPCATFLHISSFPSNSHVLNIDLSSSTSFGRQGEQWLKSAQRALWSTTDLRDRTALQSRKTILPWSWVMINGF